MKERPILFSSDMARAVLDGRKSQTRRIIKPQPEKCPVKNMAGEIVCPKHELIDSGGGLWLCNNCCTVVGKCPYGIVGDRLWCITIKPVEFYEDRYGVGDDGNVYSIKKGIPRKMMACPTGDKGYLAVTLCNKGQKKTMLVHRLVCTAFYGKQSGEVRHLDGNPQNNLPENLDWADGFTNWLDRSAMGRGVREKHHKSKLTWNDVGEIRKSKMSQRKMAKIFGVSQETIRSIRNYDTWRALPKQPPRKMPKWAARIWLKKTSDRAPERAQEITPDDIKAEGFRCGFCLAGNLDPPCSECKAGWFQTRWDSLNARPKKTKHNPYTNAREDCYVGYPWEDIRKEKRLRCGLVEYIVGNPFVWPIEFKRVREPI